MIGNTIEIENKRLHDFIVTKDELVNDGRKISQRIEDIEIKVKRFENKEKQITSKVVPPKELTDRGDELVKQVTAIDSELNKIIKEINEIKLAAVPKDMKEDHMTILKEKETLERDRNKIALKVQKIKDKLIPIIQKEVKPLLGEYDDIETAKTKDGKVVTSTFNHLTDWKKAFARK